MKKDGSSAATLVAVARDFQRQTLDMTAALDGVESFQGVDVWNAWEFTWLGEKGRPALAALRLRVPADSPCLIESKSLKLYLGSFYNQHFNDQDALVARLQADLSQVAGAAVAVSLLSPDEILHEGQGQFAGDSLDDLDVSVEEYQYNPDLLQLAHLVMDGVIDAATDLVIDAATDTATEETLHTHLFRSVCPMTGQPDYASVQVSYQGRRMDAASLLRYLISYREHAEFAEQVTERIFADIMRVCAPNRLQVAARYTRRGGIDINSTRHSPQTDSDSSAASGHEEVRLWRQ